MTADDAILEARIRLEAAAGAPTEVQDWARQAALDILAGAL